MSQHLAIAAGLLIFMGLVHSILGELLIVSPLLKQSLPTLLGTDRHTKRTIRAGWHLTSIGWWAAAGVLVTVGAKTPEMNVTTVIAAAFFLSAVVTFVVTRGVVLSWAVFLAVGLLCWAAR